MDALDRHGSWEWTGYQPGEVNRFIVLFLTNGLPSDDGRNTHNIEIWAEIGPAQAEELRRRLLLSLQVDEELLDEAVAGSNLAGYLDAAWQATMSWAGEPGPAPESPAATREQSSPLGVVSPEFDDIMRSLAALETLYRDLRNVMTHVPATVGPTLPSQSVAPPAQEQRRTSASEGTGKGKRRNNRSSRRSRR